MYIPKAFRFAAAVLAIAGSAACTSSEDQKGFIVMKDTPVYRVPAGAKVVTTEELNAFDVNHYDRLFNHHPRINQPLYRLIETPGYSVFVGLVLDKNTQGGLPDLFAGDSAWQLVETRPAGHGKLGLLANDSLYNVRFVGHSKKTDMTHLINLKTRDSATAASYYHSDSLFKGDYLL